MTEVARQYGFRILAVEDEADVCALVGDLLAADGFDPVCVGDDAAAYRVLDREARSLAALIVDINLGKGTTGFDVARYARRLNPSLPVIYITGTSMRSFAAHRVEGAALVCKPFDAPTLMGALRDQLEGPRPA